MVLLQGTCCLLYCNNSNWHCSVCSWAGSGYQQSAVQGCAGVHLAADSRNSREPVRPTPWAQLLCLVSTARGSRGWERRIPSMTAAAQFDPGICIASWLGTRSTNPCSWHQHKGQDSSAYQHNCVWEESQDCIVHLSSITTINWWCPLRNWVGPGWHELAKRIHKGSGSFLPCCPCFSRWALKHASCTGSS